MPLDSDSLKTLRDKHKHVFAAGGEKKTKERHEKGLLTTRERLTRLFQPDTFQEFGPSSATPAPSSTWRTRICRRTP